MVETTPHLVGACCVRALAPRIGVFEFLHPCKYGSIIRHQQIHHARPQRAEQRIGLRHLPQSHEDGAIQISSSHGIGLQVKRERKAVFPMIARKRQRTGQAGKAAFAVVQLDHVEDQGEGLAGQALRRGCANIRKGRRRRDQPARRQAFGQKRAFLPPDPEKQLSKAGWAVAAAQHGDDHGVKGEKLWRAGEVPAQASVFLARVQRRFAPRAPVGVRQNPDLHRRQVDAGGGKDRRHIPERPFPHVEISFELALAAEEDLVRAGLFQCFAKAQLTAEGSERGGPWQALPAAGEIKHREPCQDGK